MGLMSTPTLSIHVQIFANRKAINRHRELPCIQVKLIYFDRRTYRG
jgi:hypothetical protein